MPALLEFCRLVDIQTSDQTSDEGRYATVSPSPPYFGFYVCLLVSPSTLETTSALLLIVGMMFKFIMFLSSLKLLSFV